jgi:hypothetical protein
MAAQTFQPVQARAPGLRLKKGPLTTTRYADLSSSKPWYGMEVKPAGPDKSLTPSS